MIHFYPLTIQDIRQETEDCVSVAFAIPPYLKETFVYNQGQYLTIRAYIGGQEVRRSYSICSSPLDDELRIAIKRVEGGVFSEYANHSLKAGDELEAMPPIGRFFTRLDESHKKSYVAIAAGSGITPILSIIKTTLLTEPNSQFTLVYGNRSRQSIIFKETLDALKNRFINRFSMVHILSREKTDSPLHSGRIDKLKCQLLFSKMIMPLQTDEFFLCGPETMIQDVKESLETMGVDGKRIHFELFTSHGLAKSPVTHKPKSNAAAQASSKVTIVLDGTNFNFDLPFEGTNILDAALQQGADLPFSCKGGVCCTCRAKLLEGEVDMEVNYGLEPEEIEQGFILTCQSHPITERVIASFDVK